MLELAKGNSAIEVGDQKQLAPVINAQTKAVAAGDVDQQLTAAGAELSSRLSKIIK